MFLRAVIENVTDFLFLMCKSMYNLAKADSKIAEKPALADIFWMTNLLHLNLQNSENPIFLQFYFHEKLRMVQ